LTDELEDALTSVNLPPQELAQIATFGSEYVLPNRLITEKR